MFLRRASSLICVAMFGAALSPMEAQAGLSNSVIDLAKNCAPNVHPVTLATVVSHESANDRLAFNINTKGFTLPWKPVDEADAKRLIEWLEARGINYDLGYGQVNSANFKGLGVTAESLLDGCNNLRASAVILTDCYDRAAKESGEGQRALRQALSCYNTNSLSKGFENGYVAKVLAQGHSITVPALQESGNAVFEGAVPDESAAVGERLVDAGGEPERFESSASDGFDSPTNDVFKTTGQRQTEAAQEDLEPE